MRITELIDQLLEIRKKFGEVEVEIETELHIGSIYIFPEEYTNQSGERTVICKIKVN